MLVHVFLMFPETAGRPLEEVTELFEKKVPAWKTGNTFSRTKRAERGDLESSVSRVHSESDAGTGSVIEKEKPRSPLQTEDVSTKT
jgi:hypothetical protein